MQKSTIGYLQDNRDERHEHFVKRRGKCACSNILRNIYCRKWENFEAWLQMVQNCIQPVSAKS